MVVVVFCQSGVFQKTWELISAEDFSRDGNQIIAWTRLHSGLLPTSHISGCKKTNECIISPSLGQIISCLALDFLCPSWKSQFLSQFYRKVLTSKTLS